MTNILVLFLLISIPQNCIYLNAILTILISIMHHSDPVLGMEKLSFCPFENVLQKWSLNLQTLQILIRLLLRSSLILVYNVHSGISVDFFLGFYGSLEDEAV